ncbi:MAG: hypothetical protein EOO47_09925 [Flavobacterium sp.]|nr:MAG: hypothetical protein EOO47_09925 [Flavobacterium sp.]
MFVYITLSVLLLKWTGIWNTTLLKDSIFWTFLVAFPMMFNANKIDSFKKFKTKVILPLFKFSVIFEFIFGLYTFELWIEMLIIPIIILLVGVNIFSARKPEHYKATKLSNWMINLLVLWMFYGIGKHLIYNYESYLNTETLHQFLNPLCLSILFLPILYALSIYIHYETSLVILKRYLKDPRTYRYAVTKAILYFNTNLDGLLRWKNLMVVKHLQTKKEIDDAILLIKTLQKTEQYPHTVNRDLGWSPYSAKDFLLNKGIETPTYNNTFEDEFMSVSTPFKINQNIIEDTITYLVTGEQMIVRQLCLKLNVFYGEDSKVSRLIFKRFVAQLYLLALEIPIPPQLSDAIEIGKRYQEMVDNVEVSLKKIKWSNSSTNGYGLEFSVKHISS